MKLFSAAIFILSGAASGKAQIESTPREIDEPTAIGGSLKPAATVCQTAQENK